MEAKKSANQPNHGRAVLVPQKTVIKFDSGISVSTAVEPKPKPAVPSHKVAAQRRRSTDIRNSIASANITSSTSNKSSNNESHGEIEELSTSNVDIQLSDSIINAFMQNSPSAVHITSSPYGQQAAQIAKMRVVEEMSRIHQRAHVTDQQRQHYMQTALGMDAPRLARTIIKDERDARDEILEQADDILLWNRDERSARSSAGSDNEHSIDLEGSVSFLTGGELLILEERLREQQQSRTLLQHQRQQLLLEQEGKVGKDKTILPGDEIGIKTPTETKSHFEDDSDKKKLNNDDKYEAFDQGEQEDLDQTVRVVRLLSSAEKRQEEDDARFSKTVEEVERIRKRFIQKAALPLLGSKSNVEHLSSSSLDAGSSNSHNSRSNSNNGYGYFASSSGSGVTPGSGGGVLLRPSSGSQLGGSSANTSASHLAAAGGASVRGRISNRSSFNSNNNISSAAAAGGGSGSGAEINYQQRNSSSAGGKIHNKGAGLSISAPDSDTDTSNMDNQYPPLSPGQNKLVSPTKYLLPKRAKRDSSDNSVDSRHAEGEIYRVKSNSLSPKPGKNPTFRFDGVAASGLDSPSSNRLKSIRSEAVTAAVPLASKGVTGGIKPVSNNSTLTEYTKDTFDSYHTHNNSHTVGSGSDGSHPSHHHHHELGVSGESDVSTLGSTFSHLGTNFHDQHQQQQQQMVASSIDMLIGSRYNSERGLGAGEEEEGDGNNNNEILGSSLVLLQKQLESASDANNSYRNVFGAKGKQIAAGGGGGNNNKAMSQATATALATLNRPISSGGPQHRSRRDGKGDGNSVPPLQVPEVHPDAFRARNKKGNEHAGEVAMLKSDDSASTIGSDLFAFKSASNPPSAVKLQHSSNSIYSSGTTSSSLALSSEPSSGRRGGGAGGSGGSAAAVEERPRPLVFQTSYDDPPIRTATTSAAAAAGGGGGGAGGAVVGYAESNNSTGSSLSYSAYLNQLSKDSSVASLLEDARGGLNHQNQLNHHQHQQAHLDPIIPCVPIAAMASRPSSARPSSSSSNSANTSSQVHPNVPFLHPIDVHSSTKVNSAEILSGAHISETPKELQPIILSARQRSADKKSRSNKNVKTDLTRLSTFALDNQLTSVAVASDPASTRSRDSNCTPASRSSSTSRSRPAGTRAAQLRQNAQLLMTSPLSDWLSSAGASMNSQQGDISSSTSASASTSGVGVSGGEGLELGGGVSEQKRRNSKFTFDELQHADHQLEQSPAKQASSPNKSALLLSKSRRGRGGGRRVGQVESLPALLPSLANADPDTVQNVYRSMNILNGHFSQIGANSLNSSLAASLSLPGAAALTPNCRVAAIDQEIDDLLTGNGEAKSNIKSVNNCNNNNNTSAESSGTGDTCGAGASGVRGISGSPFDSTDIEQNQNTRRARPSRRNVLISQSCVEGSSEGTTASHHLTSLAQAGAYSLADASHLPSIRPALSASTLSDLSKAPRHPNPNPNPNPTTVTALGAAKVLQSPNNMTGISASSVITLNSDVSSINSPQTTADNTPAGADSSDTGAGGGKIPTPVRAEIEGVVTRALSRTNMSGNTAGSAASTVDMHVRRSADKSEGMSGSSGGQLGGLHSADTSASNSSAAMNSLLNSPAGGSNATLALPSSSASAPQLPLQHQQQQQQQQRLGALAAALDAGDAVGKLMAQMMIKGGKHAGGVKSRTTTNKNNDHNKNV